MQLGKEKSKKIIMLMSLAMLSSCTYFRSNPDELKKLEGAIETEVDVGIKATAPEKEIKDGQK